MSTDGQGTLWRRNIGENFNRLSRVHQRYRQTDDRQTDRPSMTYSEHKLEFTFAKNQTTTPQLIANNMSGCFFLKHGVVTFHTETDRETDGQTDRQTDSK